ncbi:hypothetical protein JVT61DRAFT_1015 [Boletus reticuloceps]|uniref:Uncharacterized protein n=1 Tax=Boletus reticuloceps TaxID=495285 RepID=A0A8I2YR54_9AGAM|nr:hypothetical protein JVT61DRAFT_1015 [Boletus reticuloceps]
MSKFAPHRKSYNNPRGTSTTVCQKCLQTGEIFWISDVKRRDSTSSSQVHFIYECKSERPYVSRPSRTEMLQNPRVLAKLKADGKPSVEVPEEFKKKSGTANLILEAKEKEREKQKTTGSDSHPKKKKARRSSRSSDSESSSSESESASSASDSSASDSDSASSSGSESSRSREAQRKAAHSS